MTSDRTSAICDACRRIDFGTALALPPRESEKILLDGDTSRFIPPLQTDCPLCKILSCTICWYHDYMSDPAAQANMHVRGFNLRAFSYLANSLSVPRANESDASTAALEQAQDCHLLLSIPGTVWADSHNRDAGFGNEGYVVCYTGNLWEEEGLFRPQCIPERFDSEKAKLWLNDCREHHGEACKNVPGMVEGMKLIDCDSLQIVKAESSMRWAALSYVWGASSAGSHSADGPRALPSPLSAVVQDAIAVTTQLGLRYLWIDRYCINQSNSKETAAQVAQMNLIYGGAEITIVAAAGKDETYGLPGVGATPRVKQDIIQLETCTILSTGPDPMFFTKDKSKWWTRGWTLQEGLLSRRRLVFTEYQAAFECNTRNWMESIGGVEFLDRGRPIDWNAGRSLFRHFLPEQNMHQPHTLRPGETKIANTYTKWFWVANQYTSRDLTYETDSLRAFAGMMALMSQLDPPALSISGLPYVVSRTDEALQHVERHIFLILCWHHTKDASPRRRPTFPSWTWAGWAGRARWMVLPFRHNRACIPMLRSVSLGFENGRVVSAVEHMSAAAEGLVKHDLDRVVAFEFEARVVDPSLFHFNIRQKHMESSSSEDESEGDQDNDGATDANSHSPFEMEPEPEPDRNDWEYWTVGMHKLLLKRTGVPPLAPQDFLDRLDSGSWSCLLLGDCNLPSFSHRRFLLVVEWLDKETATRVGSLLVDQQYYLDEKYPDFFDESELEWRKVRLV